MAQCAMTPGITRMPLGSADNWVSLLTVRNMIVEYRTVVHSHIEMCVRKTICKVIAFLIIRCNCCD